MINNESKMKLKYQVVQALLCCGQLPCNSWYLTLKHLFQIGLGGVTDATTFVGFGQILQSFNFACSTRPRLSISQCCGHIKMQLKPSVGWVLPGLTRTSAAFWSKSLGPGFMGNLRYTEDIKQIINRAYLYRPYHQTSAYRWTKQGELFD